MNILFINACVRENSRTLVLARDVMKTMDADITEINLEKEMLQPLDGEALAKRDRLIREGKLDDPMFRFAKQFAEADEIIIAAPFWDLSFPALLKIYLEQIAVVGITFVYQQNGRPKGFCRAKRLTYVTTSGGMIVDDFGYAYVKALAKNFYGISNTVCYRAMLLDAKAIPAERVLQDAEISVVE